MIQSLSRFIVKIKNNQGSLFIISFAVSFSLYYKSFYGPFMLDDYFHIVDNSHIWIKNLSFESFIDSTYSYKTRPLSMMSIALNYYFDQLNPFWYKLTNYLAHYLNSILIYFISQKILSDNTHVNNRKQLSFLISFIWLILPINLSAVSYVIQRMTVFSTSFILLSILSYIKLRQEKPNNKKIILFQISVITFFIFMAFLFKEIAILTFLYIILFEIFLYFKYKKHNHILITYRKFLILLIALIIFSCYLITLTSYMDAYNNRTFTLYERLLTQSRMIIIYITNIYIPLLENLNIYNDHYIISKSLFDPLTTFFSLFLILSIITGLIVYGERIKYISLGIFIFITSHILESTVLPLEIYYEHRNYFASFGLIFSLLIIIENISLKINLKNLMILSYILFLSTTLGLRSIYWSSENLFYNNEVRKNNTSYRAHYYTAIHILKTKGNKEQLEYHLRQASYLKKDQTHTLFLMLMHSTPERYNKIKENISKEINSRLKNEKISRFDIANLPFLHENILNNRYNIDNELFIGFITTLSKNNVTNIEIHYWSTMFLSNYHIKIKNDCKKVKKYLIDAYNYYKEKGNTDQFNSYIPKTYNSLIKFCRNEIL